MQHSDDEIVKLIREQSANVGLNCLFEKYGQVAVSFIRHQIPGIIDHQIFAAISLASSEVWKSIDQYDSKAPLRDWYLGICRNEAARVFNKEISLTTEELKDDHAAIIYYVRNPAVPRKLKKAAKECICKLSKTERTIIEADVENGKEVDDNILARKLGLNNPNSVIVLRATANRKIRECLNQTDIM